MNPKKLFGLVRLVALASLVALVSASPVIATTASTSVVGYVCANPKIPAPSAVFAVTSGTATMVAWGRNVEGQCKFPAGLTEVISIAAGSNHTVALKSDGTVTAWGRNAEGQCTVPAGLTGVAALSAGSYHTVALKRDGTVVGWGRNVEGQCKAPTGLSGVTAIAAGSYHTVALKRDGTVVAWGRNIEGQCTIPVGLRGVIAISARGQHSVALKSNGTVVAWGYNGAGQCNVPVGLTGVKAIAAGALHTVALKTNGTVVVWGSNTYGQRNIPAGLSGVITISAGGNRTVALKSGGTVVVWGDSHDVPAGLTGVTAVTEGFSHTIALMPTQRAVVNIATTTPDAEETGPISGVFTISQSGVTAASISYSITAGGVPVLNGTTTRFTVPVGPASIADGSSHAWIRVTPIANDITDGDQPVTITLLSGSGYTVGSGSTASIIVHDKDTTGPSITVTSPVDGATVNSPSLTVTGSASDSGLGNGGITWVGVNEVDANGGVASGSATATWQATIPLVAGSNIISVYADDGAYNETTKTFSVTYNPPPTVVTGAATEATDTHATLNGTVNPNGFATTFRFEYGLTGTYGMKTGDQPIGSGSSVVACSGSISGLAPANCYHYRVIAASSSGTSYGGDRVLATLPAATSIVSFAGDEAADIPGAPFLVFGSPAINDTNAVAMQAIAGGTAVTLANRTGIWVESGSSRSLIARTGDAAPGIAGGIFATLHDPVFNGSAHTAFCATLQTGTGGITTTNAAGLWATTTGSLTLIAQAGMQAPGCPAGAKFSAFSKLVLTELDQVLFTATLATAGAVTAANNQGIWIANNHGVVTLLLRKGGPLKIGTATKTVLSFSVLGSPAVVGGQSRNFNRTGLLTGLVTFTDGATGIVKISPTGAASMVVLKNAAAQAMPGAAFAAFGDPAINDAGQSAFLATVAGLGITSANNTGIWADSGGARGLVARTGAPAAGVTGGLFATLGDPAYNNNGRVAFLGTLRIGVGGVIAANAAGIWSNASGVLKPIARAQAQATGCPTGAKFASFTKLVLPDRGGPVFLASLASGLGGVTTANNQGLWAVNTAGVPRLIVRKGSPMTLDATQKTVAAIVIFDGASEVTSQSRSFNRSGDLIYRLTFTDGTQGLFEVAAP